MDTLKYLLLLCFLSSCAAKTNVELESFAKVREECWEAAYEEYPMPKPQKILSPDLKYDGTVFEPEDNDFYKRTELYNQCLEENRHVLQLITP